MRLFSGSDDWPDGPYGPFKVHNNSGDVIGEYYDGDESLFDSHMQTFDDVLKSLREKEVEAIQLGRGLNEVTVLNKDHYPWDIFEVPVLIKMEKVIDELRAGNVTVKEFIKLYRDTRKEARRIAEVKWRKAPRKGPRWSSAALDQSIFNQLAGVS